MTGLTWFKCYPRDFNEGMTGLTLEERGAYATLINMIYARGGPIIEEPWRITSVLGCTGKTWVKIRAALIVKGKLEAVVIDGSPHLMNARAGIEISKFSETSKKLSEAGSKRPQKQAPETHEINDLAPSRVKPRIKPGLQISEAETDTELEPPKANALAPPGKSGGTRLSEDWVPTEADIAMARKRGLNDQEIDIEADRFRNYWLSCPGAKGRKSSWSRTWDNRCIDVVERRGNGPRLAASTGQPRGDGRGGGSFADVIAKRRGLGP